MGLWNSFKFEYYFEYNAVATVLFNSVSVAIIFVFKLSIRSALSPEICASTYAFVGTCQSSVTIVTASGKNPALY